MSEDSDLVLRFRDLITGYGKTLHEHRRIIAQMGYTWWGWWRKPYELVPKALLWDLTDRCPTHLYLFDSGNRGSEVTLYRATLGEVAVAPNGADIPSPKVDATPNYYNAARYGAWFKLTDISTDPIVGTTLAPIGFPTWPESADAHLTKAVGIDISTSQDLRRLDVTLLVARVSTDDVRRKSN